MVPALSSALRHRLGTKSEMRAVMFIVLAGLSCIIQPSVAQTFSTLTVPVGGTATFECNSGTFTYPEWLGPPSFTVTYTNMNSAAINPSLQSYIDGRLTYHSNDRDLILKNVENGDAGQYKCAKTGHIDHIIELEVTASTTTQVPPPEYKCKCPLWKCNNSAECNRCWIVLILIIILIIWLGGGVVGGLLIGLCITCRPEALKGCYDCKASDCSECCSKCCQRCDNNIIRCKCCCSCFYIDWAPFWYYILWWTVIGTPVAFGIFIIMKCSKQGNGDVKPKEEKPRHETQSGNTRTGPKKPETKKNESKDSVAHIENEQHNQGRKHREQPPPPSDAGAATGTILHGREDSDSAVSREHVHLQESGRTLPQRPMPGIPSANDRQGYDNKGRGLSATFNDEDHPLVAIDTPSQKKGALESLPEGTGGEGSVKKLKKKKKKSKDREDEM